MKLALFAFGQEDHVGIVEEDGIFDLTRAMQAYDLFNKNIQTAPVTSIHEMLDKNMVRPAVIEPVVDFIDRHNLRQALTVPEGAADHPLRAPIRRPGKIIALSAATTPSQAIRTLKSHPSSSKSRPQLSDLTSQSFTRKS